MTRVTGVACSLVLATITFGSGVAAADAYVGNTYADAAAKIADRNMKPIVATVSGSQLPTDECIVVGSHRGIFLDSSGDVRKREFFLNLNCNQLVAAPGRPGNSVTTPAGAKEKGDEEFAAKINANPAICERSESVAKRCARVCTKQGLCEYQA